MTIRRHAAKRDFAEPLVVEALQAAGCQVYRTDKPFDLIISHPSFGAFVLLAECKTGNAKLNANQERDSKRFPVHVLRNDTDAIDLLMRAKRFFAQMVSGRAA